MRKKINEELDNFFNDDLMLNVPTLTSLNDDIFEDYSDYEIDDENIVTIDDSEFDKILERLGSSEKTNKKISDEVEALSDIEIEYAKLEIAREELEQERAAFERQKKEWETLRKLSEESFRAEKEEYAKKIKLEKEKMYLETRKIINSCTDVA